MARTLIAVALVSGVFGGACTASVVGEAPEKGPALPIPGEPPVVSATTCDGAALLSPRLVRLAATDLREHVRRSLPGVGEKPLSSVALQAEHLASLTERVVSGADFGAYYEAARAVAESFVSNAAEARPCRQAGAEEMCLQAALSPAVGRLYRTPPSAGEWADFDTSYRKLLATHGTAGAAAAVIASALLSPRTLYQPERGEAVIAPGTFALAKHEALSAARFALTGRAPEDSELAAVSQLDQTAFRAKLGELAAGWAHGAEFAERALDFTEARFGIEHLAEVSRLDPAFTDDVKLAMAGEFRDHVSQTFLSASGSFERLFTVNPPTVFAGLESIYAVPGADPANTGGSRRLGVLGLAGLLAARSGPAGSDPVKRGLMVRVELLCESMPPPIPDADFGKVTVTEDMQTRERFEALAAMPACRSCHEVINPPGYLFEEFDQLGRHRTQEKGRPINPVGTISPYFGREPYAGVETWDGIVPLARWLGQSPRARACFATHFASYVLAEAVPHGTDNCSLSAATARFLASGRLDELTQDLVQSELFLYRSRGAL